MNIPRRGHEICATGVDCAALAATSGAGVVRIHPVAAANETRAPNCPNAPNQLFLRPRQASPTLTALPEPGF